MVQLWKSLSWYHKNHVCLLQCHLTTTSSFWRHLFGKQNFFQTIFCLFSIYNWNLLVFAPRHIAVNWQIIMAYIWTNCTFMFFAIVIHFCSICKRGPQRQFSLKHFFCFWFFTGEGSVLLTPSPTFEHLPEMSAVLALSFFSDNASHSSRVSSALRICTATGVFAFLTGLLDGPSLPFMENSVTRFSLVRNALTPSSMQMSTLSQSLNSIKDFAGSRHMSYSE